MSQIQIKSRGNQSIECARLIASFFVVFIHVPFPGGFGAAVRSVARFAVPMFFVISGYFSYQVSEDRLKARIWKMLWLNVAATPIYIYRWSMLDPGFQWVFPSCLLRLLPTKEQLAKWLVLSLNPYSEHLWYLAAMVICYLVYWLYIRFYGKAAVRYEPFYGLCAGLGLLQLVLGQLAPMLGMQIPYELCRNAFLPGLPLFGLGLFLRQYRQRILENYALTDKKLLLILVLGFALSFLRTVSLGEIELPFAMVVAVAALLLLLEGHPVIAAPKGVPAAWISKFGFLSTAIYILHQFVGTVYAQNWQLPLAAMLGEGELWLRPLLVLGLTLLAAIVCQQAAGLLKKRRK